MIDDLIEANGMVVGLKDVECDDEKGGNAAQAV